MKNKLRSFKRATDKIYDILIVQLIGTVVVLAVILTFKLFGGNRFETFRSFYISKYNTSIKAEDISRQDVDLKTEDDAELADEQEREEDAEINETPQTTQTSVFLSKLIWPITGKVTSEYGYRKDPFTGVKKYHSGIDISSDEGTEIKAVSDGEVIYAGYNDSYGYHLIISHGGSFSSKYAHCSKLIAKKGDKIKQGEVIALVGDTGRATGSHLHLEIIVKDSSIDPRWLLPSLDSV